MDEFGISSTTGSTVESANDTFYSTLLTIVDPAIVKNQLNSVEAQQWALDRYETLYGIFNHDIINKSGDEYALVRQHPAEDTSVGDILYERLREYRECCVREHTGLSFNELLDMPRHVVIEIFRQCRQVEEKRPKLPVDIKKLNKALR